MLPKIDLPIFNVNLPSSGKLISVRPFLVKEEKLLLMALESNDNKEIIDITKQVINNCILSGENVEDMPFFDVDYLFIALRAKSIGEYIDVKFTCNNMIDDGRCGNIFDAKIDISNCEVINTEPLSNIQLSDKVIVQMKYPTYTTMKNITSNSNILDKKIHIIAGSIGKIIDGDNVISLKDITKEELIQFIEGLTREQFSKLEHFVNNFPSFVVVAEETCNVCGFNHKLQYKEFESFFV